MSKAPTMTLTLMPHPMGWARRVRGFTLIELMITVAIAAILATLAVPAYNEAMLGSKLNTLANSFVLSTQLARSEAIKRNAPVTMCASSNGTSCGGTWKEGWVVLVGANPLHTQEPLPKGFLISGAVSSIVFQPTGLGATQTSLTLCRATPTVGSSQRTLTVSATGRAGIAKVTGASSCSE